MKVNKKIAFGMIVFEGDYVLEACLKQVYPYATQILIAEGPVKFWQEKGRITSSDKTNKIIDNFPDPDNKIKIIHNQYSEKDEQCSAYMQHLDSDIDYLWNLDSDEVYKSEDIEKIINIMEEGQYTSADVKSCSFYGGFERYIGGFEEKRGNFHRIFRIFPGTKWLTHRPPTVVHDKKYDSIPMRHIDGDTLWFKYGIRMYHYSYVFPKQVKNKIEYYEAKVSREKCFKKYFETIYLPWVQSNSEDEKLKIEMINEGVHEFIKGTRTHTFTKRFEGDHPESIKNSLFDYNQRIKLELKEYKSIDVECWNSNDVCKYMLDGAEGKTWAKLEKSSHWPTLKKILDSCVEKGASSVCDVGCGAGDIGNIYKKIAYTGADLPHIIENVSQKFSPDLDFIKFDINKDVSFLKNYDCLVLGAFIDVMEKPLEVLSKILKNSNNFVIIHRQHLGKGTKSWLTTSYGGMTSYQSQIDIDELKEVTVKHGYSISFITPVDGQFSLLLEKI
jgi:hypothetical protein